MIQACLSGLVSCSPICQYSTVTLFFQHLRHTSLSPVSESCSSFTCPLCGSFILEFRSLLNETFFDHPTYHLGFPYSSVGEGDGTPLQCSCLENPMDGGAWWATVHGVAKSPTQLSDFTFTFHFHAMEKEMATHSSVLVWRISGTVEPGGLPSMGSCRVGHN